MGEIFATGTWTPKNGEEAAFIEAWVEFATWASENEGVGTLRLARDAHDSRRFVSFARWSDGDAFRGWKSSAGAQKRMRRVQTHIEEFKPSELEIVATVRGAG
jgi:heme-degrading monooxygenase HmoA